MSETFNIEEAETVELGREELPIPKFEDPCMPEDSDSPSERKVRIHKLRRQIRELQRNLYSISTSRPKEPRHATIRTWWGPCKRCGYIWLGNWLNSIHPPLHCAKCHSSAWRVEPVYSRDRRPDSTPNPNWDKWHGRSDASKRISRDRSTGIHPRIEAPEPIREVPQDAIPLATSAEEILSSIPIPPPPKIPSSLPPPPFVSLSAALAERRALAETSLDGKVEPEPEPEPTPAPEPDPEPDPSAPNIPEEDSSV